MKVKVEIESKQIMEDGNVETEKNICDGEITYHDKGTILEFIEKHEEQELKFKMTILENKMLINRNDNIMTLDLQNTTKATLDTPYGIIPMQVSTKNIEIIKQESNIESIRLEYQIELEESIKYDCIVNINIKEIL